MGKAETWCKGKKGQMRKACIKKHKQIDEMYKDKNEQAHKLLNKAFDSGCIDEDYQLADDYVLSKMVLTIQDKKKSYEPFHEKHRKDMRNLEHCI